MHTLSMFLFDAAGRKTRDRTIPARKGPYPAGYSNECARNLHNQNAAILGCFGWAAGDERVLVITQPRDGSMAGSAYAHVPEIIAGSGTSSVPKRRRYKRSASSRDPT